MGMVEEDSQYDRKRLRGMSFHGLTGVKSERTSKPTTGMNGSAVQPLAAKKAILVHSLQLSSFAYSSRRPPFCPTQFCKQHLF